GRQIFMGFVTPELLAHELSGSAPDLAAPAEQLIDEVDGPDTIRLRGRAGTDLTLKVAGRPWKTDTGPLVSGEGQNYPGGEIYIAPHAAGADGVLVVDLTVP